MNRTYLTILSLAGTLLGASVAASAQSNPGPADAPPGRHMNVMTRAMQGIALSPSEQSAVQAAQDKFHAARKTATPETRAELKDDIDAALSPAHREQFETNVKTMRAQMRADRRPGGEAPSPSAT